MILPGNPAERGSECPSCSAPETKKRFVPTVFLRRRRKSPMKTDREINGERI